MSERESSAAEHARTTLEELQQIMRGLHQVEEEIDQEERVVQQLVSDVELLTRQLVRCDTRLNFKYEAREMVQRKIAEATVSKNTTENIYERYQWKCGQQQHSQQQARTQPQTLEEALKRINEN